ncbi:MAG: Phosphocholine transferase AnkX [candidate division BRC1 bacterium ADurb.BinA364]|nr:MAG: Phosphocholine transferase AnkX [candidate division BRC1 bacterium ADurb.BinA364]
MANRIDGIAPAFWGLLAMAALAALGCGGGSPEQAPADPAALEQMRNDAYEGRIDAVRAALAQGADPDAADADGRTALMLAAFNGHLEIARELIGRSAQVDLKDAAGRTALLYAATGTSAEMAKLLLENGADVNTTDTEERWTALMFAASEGNVEVARALLDAGADTALQDTDGDGALQFAMQNGHTAMVNLLKTAQTKPQSP